MLNILNKISIFFILILSMNNLCYAANTSKTVDITFGVYQSDKASEMHSKFKPLIDYLSNKVSESSKMPVKVQLKIYPTYEKANEALANGQVDFVRFGPASYILAKLKQPTIQLLAMEEKKGKTRFNGLIVVLDDSSFKTLSDLKGSSFAFGNETSTIGRYLAQSELLKVDINAKQLSKFSYLGRHDKVFKAVELGDFAAGSLKESTFNKMNNKNQLRILHSFDNVTKPWIARAGLSTTIVKSLSNALVEITDPKLLKQFKVSSFVKAKDDDYQYVREGMLLSEQF